MKIVIAILVVLCATAHADLEGQCVEQWCVAGTKHAGQMFRCDQPACLCDDSCTGQTAPNPNGAALVEAAAKAIAYVFMPVAIFMVPGHMLEALGGRQIGTSAEAKAERDAYVKRRLALEAAGRAAEPKREALWAGYDKEPDAMRDVYKGAPAALDRKKKPLTPVPKPHLVPSLDVLCRQAAFLMPSIHTGGPIGGFPSELQMMGKCQPFFVAGQGAVACGTPGAFDCGLAPAVCCPKDFPYYNECNQQCYESTDFRAAGEAAMHCQARACQYTYKP